MTDTLEPLANDLERMLESDAGIALVDLGEFVRSRIKTWATLFLVGMFLGYPLAGEILTMLVGMDELLPPEVSIVVLQPLEVVLLQLRIAAHLATALVVILAVIDITRLGSKNEELRSKISGLKWSNLSSLAAILQTTVCSIGLGVAGVFYVFEILLPLLLEYLQADAASIGATTTWQLSAWIGFIGGLTLGAVVGFQVPLVTLIALRAGLVEKQILRQYRRHLWFTAFCCGALLSPPDPLSMFLVAAPMAILFECALVVDRLLP